MVCAGMTDIGLTQDKAPEIFAERSELQDTAASLIVKSLHLGLLTRGTASLVVTGGRIVGGIYDRLACNALSWKAVTIILSDERWVDPTSKDSNEYLVRRHLLQENAAAARFIPLFSKQITQQAAAASASARIADIQRPFDLVLLGMGEDGHFASLFPGSSALGAGLSSDTSQHCIAVPAANPAPGQPRLSLTVSTLLDSRAVLIVATGKVKRQAFERAQHVNRPADTPISSVLHQSRIPVRFLWAP